MKHAQLLQSLPPWKALEAPGPFPLKPTLLFASGAYKPLPAISAWRILSAKSGFRLVGATAHFPESLQRLRETLRNYPRKNRRDGFILVSDLIERINGTVRSAEVQFTAHSQISFVRHQDTHLYEMVMDSQDYKFFGSD